MKPRQVITDVYCDPDTGIVSCRVSRWHFKEVEPLPDGRKAYVLDRVEEVADLPHPDVP